MTAPPVPAVHSGAQVPAVQFVLPSALNAYSLVSFEPT